MVKDLKWEIVKNRPSAEAGQVRPDVRQDADRRGANNDVLRQSVRGDVPLHQKETAQPHRPTGLPSTPAHTPTTRPQVPDQGQVVGLPDTAGHQTGDAHATGTPQPRVSPNSPEMEQAVQAGKQALKALSDLAQGGKNVVPKIVTATVTPTEAFQKALAAKQSKLPANLAKTTTPDTPRTPETATKEAVLAKTKSDEQTGAKQGKDAETVATQVAQRTPSPFVTQPQGETVTAERKKEELKKIATNRESATALAGVASGIQRVVTSAGSAEDYSGGSHHGGFADQVMHDFKAMVSKAGSALNVLVYGDTQNYPETETLYAKLGLSKVLYGAQELLNRAVPVGERIANSQDNTSLFDRVIGSARDHQQMAEGGRGSPYGLGKIFG